MKVQSWLEAALADVEARSLVDLKPLLRDLADATALLRRADWNENAERDGGADTHRRTPAPGF